MDREKMIFASTASLSADPERYSFSRPDRAAADKLRESVAAYGILSPLFAVEEDGGTVLADGAARLAMLRDTGAPGAWVRIVSPDGLWDRLLAARTEGGRPLNPVETGLYLQKRMADTGETAEDLKTAVFPKLGLPPRAGAAKDPLWLAGLPREDQERFASGEVLLTGLRVLSEAPTDDAAAVLEILRPVRQGTNKFYETARWMLECAWREGKSVREWAKTFPLTKYSNNPNEFRDAVWRARYPTLASWSDSFDADAASTGLPRDITVSHATGFEGGKLRAVISFGSLEKLAESARFLAEAAGDGRLAPLGKYLG